MSPLSTPGPVIVVCAPSCAPGPVDGTGPSPFPWALCLSSSRCHLPQDLALLLLFPVLPEPFLGFGSRPPLCCGYRRVVPSPLPRTAPTQGPGPPVPGPAASWGPWKQVLRLRGARPWPERLQPPSEHWRGCRASALWGA